MPRKSISEQSLTTDRWISFDPLDNEIIERLFKKSIRDGEERLMLAVLESAVEDFQKYVLARNPSEQKLFQEAEEWLLETDSRGLFPFDSLCETLGLDPDYLRQGLLLWKDAKLKAHTVEGPRRGRPKLARTRIRHPSGRISKTA